MRTIEIDFDVHQAMEMERNSFEETPNDALRRLLNLSPVAEGVARETGGIADSTDNRSWFGKGVELPHGTSLRMEYRGQMYRGQIQDGDWVIDGKHSNSPSDAAGSAAVTKSGSKTSLNGWVYWEVKRPQDAQWRKLISLQSG